MRCGHRSRGQPGRQGVQGDQAWKRCRSRNVPQCRMFQSGHCVRARSTAPWVSHGLASTLGRDGMAGQHLLPWLSLKGSHSRICQVSVDSIVGKGNSDVQASISYELLSSKPWAPCWACWLFPSSSRNLLLAGFLMTLQHFLFPSTGNTAQALSSGSFRASPSRQNREMLLCTSAGN